MPTYRVCIIVSECILFITVFDDLNLDFNLQRHYPSWGTSASFPRGTSALRPHHSKCCIMIIIIMRLYYNTVLHVRAHVGARVRAFVCVRACARACMIIILYYYICGCSVCVRVWVRVRLQVRAGMIIILCGAVCAWVAGVRTCMYVCDHSNFYVYVWEGACAYA